MAISATDKELLKYFLLLNDRQKKSLIELMKTFFIGNSERLDITTTETYNIELNEAMQRINQGEFTSIEELEKEMAAW